ncbi:vacuole effluxer Atg22 like-domain-containing protein [Chytriomyces sp. MP71]|nr:vacuole effluxer Atg22 like-domain-containing protein [Chytriomyces sp. MP71]
MQTYTTANKAENGIEMEPMQEPVLPQSEPATEPESRAPSGDSDLDLGTYGYQRSLAGATTITAPPSMAASSTRLVRRSAIMQFQQLLALASNGDDSEMKEDTEAKKGWFGREKKYEFSRDGPLHKDIDTLFQGVRHPPLSKEELNAFYVFSGAVEPLVVVVFTALSTVVLQNLAAGAGKEAKDHSVQCNYTVPNYSCVTQIAGAWVDPASFSLYTTAASVLLQAVFFISLGALADHGSNRKKMMLFFMLFAILMCFCMISIRDSGWFLAASILIIIAQLTFGASYTFYNSYIPVFASVHWDVLSAPDENRAAVYEATMNTISAISSAYGYVGAVCCFALAGGSVFALQLVPVSTGFGDHGFAFGSMGVQTFAMQSGIFIAGIWALIGLYWPMKFIRNRPYAALPKGTNYLTYSWKQVFNSIKKARKMPNTFVMLLSWFMLSDAISTVGSTTILFATANMGFSSTEILILAIAAPLTAAGGNYLWLRVQRHFQYTTKFMLMFLVSLSVLLPVYGMLGFFLPFGLRAKWELFPAGIVYGCLLGAIQSFSRVLFSELIPRGHEGEFFALYSITDKGSSWFGPLIVGAITDATHEIRYGFIFLFFMLLLSVGCVWLVNVDKGRHDAEIFNSEDDELKNIHLPTSDAQM